MKIVSNDNKRFSFLNMTYERSKNYFLELEFIRSYFCRFIFYRFSRIHCEIYVSLA